MISRQRSGWVRVSKADPCLVCGKPDHCTRTADGLVNKCTRVESGRPKRQSDGTTAWLHSTADIGGVVTVRKATAQAPKLGRAELRSMIRQQQADLTPQKLALWAAGMGVSEGSLLAYGVGIDQRTKWTSFPMYDGTRNKAGEPNPCGIRLRRPECLRTGKEGERNQGCVPGSRNGIFLPRDYSPAAIPFEPEEDAAPLLLLMPEGPTDCCAAFDLGFRAVGRPSNNGGMDQIKEMLSWGDRQDVVIVADRDPTKRLANGMPYWPGHEGALALAEAILGACSRCRLVKPPKGTKDLRQWMREGSTADMLLAIIGEAERINYGWIGDKKRELYEWKRGLMKSAGAHK